MIRVLPYINNPKDLDPSYKMDLDFWDCFGGKKLHLITDEIQYLSDGHVLINIDIKVDV